MTARPTRAELDRLRNDLTTSLLVMQEQMAPLYDAADGMRAELTKRGWSPTSAEQVATAWLAAAVTSSVTGGQQ